MEIVYRAHAGAIEGVVGEVKSISWGGARTRGEVHNREITKHMFLHSGHGPLFFLHQFLRFVLLLLLYHSGKLVIPHDHVFLLLQILHLVLFKSLQRQGELSISGDIRVVLWWARDGNLRL